MFKTPILLFLILTIMASFCLDNYNKQSDIDFIFRPVSIKLFCGTFNNFIADIFFLRSIQLIGNKYYFDKHFNFILKNLRASQILDRHFLSVSFLGGIVLPKNIKESIASIQFLKSATQYNKKDWHIPYWIGFNYAYMMNDYTKAIHYFKIASQLKNAPRFLTSNQAMLYYKAERIKEGLVFLENIKQSSKIKGKVNQWVILKIRWLKNILFLENKVEYLKQRFKRYPKDINELIDKKIITQIPKDPFGGGYWFDDKSKRIKSKPIRF